MKKVWYVILVLVIVLVVVGCVYIFVNKNNDQTPEQTGSNTAQTEVTVDVYDSSKDNR